MLPAKRRFTLKTYLNNFLERKKNMDSKITVLCYERCTTCKKALKWLEENNVELYWQQELRQYYGECESDEVRPIKEQKPTKEELTEWYYASKLPIKKFFNTSGNIYKEQKLKEKLPTMSIEDQLELLATDGMLVKRPLVISPNGILTGFKEEEWSKVLK